MNRVPDWAVALGNRGRPWRPRIDFLARLDYYGEPAPVNRLPPPPPVPADDLRALDRLYHAPDCAGCGAPDGVPCVDDECLGHADPDAYEMF